MVFIPIVAIIESMVYYRKYRPQTIGELDSSKLRDTLFAIFGKKEVPHAFLLTGPKGLGKTSTARIIAKVINCTADAKNRKNAIEPCNTCEQCLSITSGSNIDVLEMDGASSRGIDEIRDLREKVKLAPSSAKKKIYIIDEVHMLTTEAFNALLKTIEEPPAHVLFIFATTEPQKVPETIISRCFQVVFPKATNEDIVHALERVVKGEKLAVTTDALEEIAKMADGGFRDATKILEEIVLVAGGEKITKEFIAEHYQTTNIALHVQEFLYALSEKNSAAAITKIDTMRKEGVQIKYFIEQLLQKLHMIFLGLVGVGERDAKMPAFSIDAIKTLVALFSSAYQDTKYAVIPELPLELAVVAWCQGNALDAAAVVATDGKQTMDTLLKKEKNLKVQSILRGTKEVKPEKPKTNEKQEHLTNQQNPQQFLENVIYKIKPINFSLAGILRGCSIVEITDTTVVLTTQYAFHKEKLAEPKTLTILEKAIKELTGKGLQVVVELKK